MRVHYTHVSTRPGILLLLWWALKGMAYIAALAVIGVAAFIFIVANVIAGFFTRKDIT